MSVRINFNEIKELADRVRGLQSELRQFSQQKLKYQEFYKKNNLQIDAVYNTIEKLNNELELKQQNILQRVGSHRSRKKNQKSLVRKTIEKYDIKKDEIDEILREINFYRTNLEELERINGLTEQHLSGQRQQQTILQIRKLENKLKNLTSSAKGKKTKRRKKPKKPKKKKN